MTNPDLYMESLREECVALDNAKKKYDDFVEGLEPNMQKAAEMTTKYNNKMYDICHILEMADLSWWGKVKICIILINILKERRKWKDTYSLLQSIKTNIEHKNDRSITELIKANNEKKENRRYKFKECKFEPLRKGDVFTLSSENIKKIEVI